MYSSLSGAQEREICRHHSGLEVACRNMDWSCSLSSCSLFVRFYCMGQDLVSTSSTSFWLPQVSPKYQKKKKRRPSWSYGAFLQMSLKSVNKPRFSALHSVQQECPVQQTKYIRVCFCYSQEDKEQRGYHLPITISASIFWSKYKAQVKIVKTNTKKAKCL